MNSGPKNTQQSVALWKRRDHAAGPRDLTEIMQHLFRRHVVLPQDVAAQLPKGKLLSEAEWRALGVQQSRGWVGTVLSAVVRYIGAMREDENFVVTLQLTTCMCIPLLSIPGTLCDP